MDRRPSALDRHAMLMSDRFDNCAKVKSAIRDHVKQLRRKYDPMDR